MTIGYLHIGPATHGVTRYGALLARAAREHLSDDVIEAEAELLGRPAEDEQQLRTAIQRLSRADVVHLQYNERVWGNARAAAHVRTVIAVCAAPIVATLHDVREGYGWRGIGRRTWAQRTADVPGGSGAGGGEHRAADPDRVTGLWASMQRAARYVWKEWQNTRATKHLARHAAQILVCTHEEARRLRGIVAPEQRTVLPHFVEDRAIDITPPNAQKELGLAGHRVCTVLGFIHRAKGHALVVEAMPAWPNDVHVVFAGRPAVGSEGFARKLQQRAKALGVADRLRVTGYLEEGALDTYLAATDLALCPFEKVSASGSLSTWIAAERPILASDQPQIAEYNAMAAGAIATFTPYTPAALAEAARAQLDRDAENGRAAHPESTSSVARRARAQLREKLSLPRIIQQHAAVYRAATRHTESSTPSHPE
ncbi:MAG: glycosyltransferase [Bacteroidetes bacterium]|nr:glycosyltransferase [Bacteroidota bacterium]